MGTTSVGHSLTTPRITLEGKQVRTCYRVAPSTCPSTPVALVSQTPSDKPPWVQRLGGPALSEFVGKETTGIYIFLTSTPGHQDVGDARIIREDFPTPGFWGGCGNSYLEVCVCVKSLVNGRGTKTVGARLCSAVTHSTSLLK